MLARDKLLELQKKTFENLKESLTAASFVRRTPNAIPEANNNTNTNSSTTGTTDNTGDGGVENNGGSKDKGHTSGSSTDTGSIAEDESELMVQRRAAAARGATGHRHASAITTRSFNVTKEELNEIAKDGEGLGLDEEEMGSESAGGGIESSARFTGGSNTRAGSIVGDDRNMKEGSTPENNSMGGKNEQKKSVRKNSLPDTPLTENEFASELLYLIHMAKDSM